MIVWLLDKDFKLIAPTDRIYSLQWNTKYYDIGDFELHILLSGNDELLGKLNKTVYIYLPESNYTGISQYRSYTGSDYTIKGKMLEDLLSERVVDSKYESNDNAETAARGVINAYAISPAETGRGISNLYFGDYHALGSVINYTQRGKHVSEAAGEILYTQELSYRLRFDFASGGIYFEVYQGLDRTQSQNINPWAVFSRSYGNVISNSEHYNRSGNYKNFAYVAGMGEGDERVIVTVDQIQTGELRKELWVDARDLQKDDQESDASYQEKLVTRGQQKLSEYQQIESVDFEVDTTAKTPFALGDKCTYINEDIKVNAEGRITEIRETWEASGYRKSVTLGEGQLNIIQAVKREIS